MQPTAGFRDAHELGDGAIGVGNRLQHVAADDEIELRVRQAELEDAAVLEAQALAERRAPRAGQLEMAVDDVDAEHARPRKHLRQPV